jgi:nucleoid-associated protein YgaU
MFARIAVLALVVTLAWAVAARSSSAAGAERAYIVRAGDTLWSIAAERYGGDPRRSIWKIEQRNGLLGHGPLRVGQKLVLP